MVGRNRTGTGRARAFRFILAVLAAILAVAGAVLARSRAGSFGAPSSRRERVRGFSLDFMAPFYDSFISLVGFGAGSRRRMVELAGIKPGERVLDVGCGTGELALFEKDAVGPMGHVAGIDIGPRLVETARAKVRKSGKEIDFRVASVESLPYPDDSFDVVTSTLMLHHLPTEAKRTGLAEVFRVLRPGGRLLIVDLGPASPPLASIARFLATILFFVPELVYSLDNVAGRIPGFLREAGFPDEQTLAERAFLGLSLRSLLVRKPS